MTTAILDFRLASVPGGAFPTRTAALVERWPDPARSSVRPRRLACVWHCAADGRLEAEWRLEGAARLATRAK